MDIEKLDRYMARSAASYRSNGASCGESRTSFFVDSLQTWHGQQSEERLKHYL